MTKNGLLAMCLLILTGCGMEGGLVGNWELCNVRPPELAGCYDIAAATFNSDCTYVAKVRKGDRTEISRGTYCYDRWSRRLTLRSQGIERTYSSTIWLAMRMSVECRTPDGQTVTAVMARSREAVKPEPARTRKPKKD